MAIADWLANLASRWWTGRHRVAVVAAVMSLPDGRPLPVVRVRNAGQVGVWIDAIAGVQDGRVFVIPDRRLPVQLQPNSPWMDFPVIIDAPFKVDEPWIAIAREPNGTEHQSS